MNKKPAKANLFRFVTVRNPQLLDENADTLGFIHHPDSNQSAFITTATGTQENDTQTALKAAASSFDAMKKRSAVRDVKSVLYDFSAWLMRNKSALSFVSIRDNSNEVSALSTAQELELWENLIYQTIDKKSIQVREALIQTLIAHNFIKEFNDFAATVEGDIVFTDEQLEEFTRRAHASIVIPNVLTAGNRVTRNAASTSPDKKTQELHRNTAQGIVLEQKIADYSSLLTNFEDVEKVFTKENDTAYTEALENHNETVHLSLIHI